MKVILTGSIAFDYLMKFPGRFQEYFLPDHLDKISLSFLVDEMVRHDGGVGPNIAYTLSMLGGNSYLYSAAGKDFPEYGKKLEAVGVDISGVKIIPEKFTASFFATTDVTNAQIASFYTGAMADSAEMPLSDAKYDPEDYVMISPTDPRAMERYIHESAELGIRMIFDPGQQIIRSDGEMLRQGIKNAYGLFVNDYEFELLQKISGMEAEEILRYPAFSVITLGDQGAHLHTQKEDLHVPAIPNLKIIDPTGVGDAFRGGFMRGYMANRSLKVCGEMGTVAAAWCIVCSGPQSHCFNWEEFKQYYRQYFDDLGELDQLDQ